MTPHRKLLAIVVTALMVSIVSELLGQELAPTKRAYVPTGQEATLSGSVTFTGKLPKPLKIDMSADPSCDQVNSDPTTEFFVGSKDKLANVMVYVTSDSILEQYLFEPPSSAVVMERKACRYESRVVGIQVNQPLMIINSDDTQHNTHPTPKLNPEWNQTQPVGSPPLVKTFARAELFIPLRCNQHPWEKAYLSVFSHPFFAVSDVNGYFKIEGLPPGSYKIIAWHEKLGEKTEEVVFAPGESRTVSFTFAEDDLKEK